MVVVIIPRILRLCFFLLLLLTLLTFPGANPILCIVMAASEPEPGPEGEPPASEPTTLSSAEEPAAEGSDARSYLLTILPPVLLILAVLVGILSLRVRYMVGRYRQKTAKKGDEKTFESRLSEKPEVDSDVPNLITAFDIEVLNGLVSFSNQPKDLLMIAIPALVSLGVSPILMNIYRPLCMALWQSESQPNINDAIACFLTPAGLVYATSFGFAFQSAIQKSALIARQLMEELSLIDQIVTLANKLTLNAKDKLEVYRAVKAEAIFMALQIQDKEPSDFKDEPTEDVKIRIWSVVDILKRVDPKSDEFDRQVNKILVTSILEHIMQLNSICSDRMGVFKQRIHILKWVFLESLGLFSFFGVLLIKTYSTTLDLTICFITVASISLLCYVVSDYDSPFSGFFRVNLLVLHDVVERIDGMYKLCAKGDQSLWKYPPRSHLSRLLPLTEGPMVSIAYGEDSPQHDLSSTRI